MPEEVMALGFFFLMVLPILILILTRHQQKMAGIVNSVRDHPQVDEALREEVRQLRAMLAQQTIALDSLAQSQKALAQKVVGQDDLRQRMEA